jgi:hypothetical protein
MGKITSFIKGHPVETALLAGVAAIALYYLYASNSSSSGANQEAALQNAYFQAEGLQAQAGAAIQVANINANAATTLNQQNTNASVVNNSTWATADTTISESNNQTATAALPYAEESDLIGALAGVASQTSTTTQQSSSSGFLGIGGGSSSSTTTGPTASALAAGNYLDELSNGNYPSNG